MVHGGTSLFLTAINGGQLLKRILVEEVHCFQKGGGGEGGGGYLHDIVQVYLYYYVVDAWKKWYVLPFMYLISMEYY